MAATTRKRKVRRVPNPDFSNLESQHVAHMLEKLHDRIGDLIGRGKSGSASDLRNFAPSVAQSLVRGLITEGTTSMNKIRDIVLVQAGLALSAASHDDDEDDDSED